jgi:hypothetical protein
MKQMGLSPFEVLYGHTSPLIKAIRGHLKEIGDLTPRQQMKALRLTLSKINGCVWERLPVRLATPTHPYRLRDAIWVKRMECPTIKTSLERPFFCYFIYSHCS